MAATPVQQPSSSAPKRISDEEAMRRALALAALGATSTHPNPRVGCIIVNEGVVVGEGWHHKAGEPHAEVHALAQAGARARGATAYVTLEPCAHHGRTPPCADALIAAGLGRVVGALRDPDPRVAGGGFARLRAAGIEVLTGVCATEAADLNRGFLSRLTRKRPWVTLKIAASVDGRTALANGQSQWITGPASRADVHRRRAEAGAVLVGAGTVLADNPSLTVRDWSAPLGATVRPPDRIVLDRQARVPVDSKVWADDGARRLWVVADAQTTGGANAQGNDRANVRTKVPPGVQLLQLPLAASGHLPLDVLLNHLAAWEVGELLVEAGSELAGAWLAQQDPAASVDELMIYLAPMLLGDGARALAQWPALDALSQAPQFAFTDVARIGDDLRVTLRPRAAAAQRDPFHTTQAP